MPPAPQVREGWSHGMSLLPGMDCDSGASTPPHCRYGSSASVNVPRAQPSWSGADGRS
jgi:hypothetical protein